MKYLSLLFAEEWNVDTLSCNGLIVFWACYIEDGSTGFLKLKLNLWLSVKKNLYKQNTWEPSIHYSLVLGWISSRSLSVSPEQPSIVTAALPRFQNHSRLDVFLEDPESYVLVCICEWPTFLPSLKPNVTHRLLKNDSSDKQQP